MKLRLQPPDEDDEIDITPMIDCVFLLVLFFMVTSSFIDEAKAFKVTLPTADQALTIQRDQVDTVGVTADGQVFFVGDAGEEKLPGLEVLVEKLRQRPDERRNRPVLLRCDARSEYRQFIQVKNALKLAGVETVFEEVEVGHGKGQP